VTNRHHLTSQSTPCCPTTQRSYCDQRLLWRHITLCIGLYAQQTDLIGLHIT